MFTPGFTSPTLLEGSSAMPLQDFHLLRSDFPDCSRSLLTCPVSLAATHGIEVSFFSYRY